MEIDATTRQIAQLMEKTETLMVFSAYVCTRTMSPGE